MKKIVLAVFAVLMTVQALSFSLTPALASVDQDIRGQLEPIGDVYGNGDVSEVSLAETIAELIRIVLGFLGIIFIVLFVYAGFVWMTSGGNEEKISKAKGTMTAAIIGVAIILAAYVITFFVFDTLLKATGIEEGGLS